MATAYPSCSHDQTILDRYTADGFVAVGRVLDAALLQRLGERIDAIASGEVPAPEDRVRFHAHVQWGPGTGIARRDAVWQILDAHGWDEVVATVAAQDRILALATLLLGAPAAVRTSQVITKPARHGALVPWHQDASYWGQQTVATCWIAIDDATAENGCMRLIPGSHQQGQRAFSLQRFEEIHGELRVTADIDEQRQVALCLPAGAASFHSPWTLHASGANHSDRRRRAIALTYAPVGA